MPDCTLKNTSDGPLCITNPDTGEVYMIPPGKSFTVKSEWSDVKSALTRARGQICSVKKGAKKSS